MIFTGALIAGGESSRMGRDKRSLQFGDRKLVDLQIEKLWNAGATEVLLSVADREGVGRRNDCRIVEDRIGNAGPLAGLASCFDNMKTEMLLTMAVDLPLATESLIARLARLGTSSCGFIFENEGRLEPLLAIYPRMLTELANDLLAAKDYSLQGFVKTALAGGHMQSRVLPATDRMRLMNVNTPEDLARVAVRFPELFR